MTRRLRKIVHRIKKYSYRRRDGKVIDVKSHLRTYWKKATSNTKVMAKKSAKELAKSVGIYGFPALVTHFSRARPMTPEEIKSLKRSMGIPEETRIIILKEPISAIVYGSGATTMGGGRFYTMTLASDSLRKTPIIAHELGHIATQTQKKGVMRRIALFGSGVLGRSAYYYGIPLMSGRMKKSKRKTILISLAGAPVVASEAYASYLGYKGLKKMKGKITPSEALVLASSPAIYGMHLYKHAKKERKKKDNNKQKKKNKRRKKLLIGGAVVGAYTIKKGFERRDSIRKKGNK